METTDFLKKFAEALEIEPNAINEGTNFRELDEWDSLSYLSIIAMLDEEYDIQIENASFRQLKTIGDIINFIGVNK